MDKMRQEINNLGEQVSKILELLSMGKGKVVVDITQSSNPIQDTDDPIYPPGFTPYHMNVPQSQTTQHYVPTNPLYVVPPIVPGLIIPAKFKVSEFDKYDGSTCPRSHLIMYCRKMAANINNDKLLVHCFQDSLTGPANRLDLQQMEKKRSESFKEYAQQWRDMAAEVQPPLTDKEITSMFMNTLRAPFYGRMIAPTVSETPKPINSNSPRPLVQGQVSSYSNGSYTASLPKMVQSLINAGWLSFKKSGEKPNVNENPQPSHENPKVNAVDGLVEKCKNEVHEIVMPMEALFEAGYVITGSSVDNIIEISGITRSGRFYKSDNLTVPSDDLILEQGRKNEKINVKNHCKDQDVEMPIIAKDIEYKKLVTDEEANEFLKIVKQKLHRKVLLDILNKAHVGHDISVENFSGIIGNITSSNSIVFTDDEIPPEGLGHTKALHIQVKCKDYVIARVLVDNGSTLNIMPKSTLLKLPVDMSHIKSSTMVVKAFDGSSNG
ncbi:Gag-pro-like protein [Cucumis melo var. makuwa]|uniref:Gag-pro-like protein n=1 Tax=Cucumis melo var. makuwa TaxID=1194695 RepID=A0A5D3DK47_CUCMM|nr:Gag-pro-like protein [Cucumis melo var. makuwa]